MLHDLDTLYADRIEREGSARASLWYARQTIGFVGRVGIGRIARFMAGSDGLRDEIRMSARSLGRRPAFSLAFVFTLAVGIGVLSTVYAAARWVLLRPVPQVSNPQALVVLRLRMAAAPPHVAFDVSQPDLEALRDRLPVRGALAASTAIDVDLSGNGWDSAPRRSLLLRARGSRGRWCARGDCERGAFEIHRRLSEWRDRKNRAHQRSVGADRRRRST
jgi:hypothetical protein